MSIPYDGDYKKNIQENSLDKEKREYYQMSDYLKKHASEDIVISYSWTLKDSFLAYFCYPLFVVALLALFILCCFVAKRLDLLFKLIFLMPVIVMFLFISLICSTRYYKRKERMIILNGNKFTIKNFILNGKKNFIPKFYPELSFSVQDIENVLFNSPDLSVLYIKISVGIITVSKDASNFNLLKIFLLNHAKEKFKITMNKYP